MADDNRLNIFEALDAIDLRDGDWLARQPVERQPSLALPVFLRWASTVRDGPVADRQLHAVNDRVNLDMWALAGHPELVFKLAASCGDGISRKHEWPDSLKRRAGSSKLRDFIARYYGEAGDQEIDLLLSLYNPDAFEQFLDDTACDPAERKEIKAAYDAHTGKTKAPKKSRAKARR